MLTKVVLIGLLIVLFLWVLYERKCARDLLKERLKREGYQLFTFNYTDEAPKEDFSGEHPEYQFREFYREHFSEFGRTFSDSSLSPGCPSTVCSNVQANSLTTINPISVDSSGFVMTLDMGRLPRQYHYRTTNKNSGVYTGLDEAMVWNGFDINHEKSSMPGHNPNVRGFAGECQKTTANCTTDTATGKRDCKRETVEVGGTATDLNTLDHFMFKSADVNDKKQGLGRYLDKQERVIFIKIGRSSEPCWIVSDTPNKNLLYAYGRYGNYVYGLRNTDSVNGYGLTLTHFASGAANYDSYFGDSYLGIEKSLYLAFQLDSDADYQALYTTAQEHARTTGIKERIVDIVDGNVFVITMDPIQDWVRWNFWGEVARDFGSYDARGQYNVLFQWEAFGHNIYRVFSDQIVRAVEQDFAGQDPFFGTQKWLRIFPYRGRYLTIDNDTIPFLFAQPPINVPNVGHIKAITSKEKTGGGYVYPSATGLNARATSIFDQTPVLLREPVGGVCSISNISHSNVVSPDFSDPNTSTYFSLDAPNTLYPSGPSKLTTLYSSELVTLEMHRNSVAYGGFVMNTSSTSSLFQAGPLNAMTNNCTIQPANERWLTDIRKRLVDAGIAGNADCDSQNDSSARCVPSPMNRLYTAIGIINDRGTREKNATVVLLKLIEWNLIRWFAYTKGIPTSSQWRSKYEELFAYCYNQITSQLGIWFLSDAEFTKNMFREEHMMVYSSVISPLIPSGKKNSNVYKNLANQIGALSCIIWIASIQQYDYISNSSITPAMNQFLFDLFYCNGDTVRVRGLLNSYDPNDRRRTWLYALYPEDRKRSRIYFDGYAADSNNRWASYAFSVANNRSVVVPRKFTRGTDAQMTMVNSFPRVYSVLKFYSSSNDVIFTLFWAHIPLYPGCGYPTMNYEITDKYGKPDFMNNNYSDNIFIFYLIGSESKWKQEIIDNGIYPICEEDFYIESVYHGSAMCLRSIDNASKRLNCGNYVLFGEDGLTATVAPKDTNASETLGGEMGSFRIYCDEKGVFVYKRKISTTSEALQDYTVYSDYISVPGMKSCTGFSCWTPFREANGTQSVFKSIRVEPPLLGDALDSSKPPSAATPVQVTATDNYRNLAQKREMIQTYASLKHPTHPARVNTPVIKNINVLKAEGWRIVNVGGSGWVDPATTYLNTYKIQQKDDYTVAPYYMNYSTKEAVDAYGGVVGTMVSKWGLPTQEKYITRGEWIQIEYPNPIAIEEYRIVIPMDYNSGVTSVTTSSMNARNILPINRSMSHWTFLGSNDIGVNKKWVLIDIQKDVDFSVNTSESISVSGNRSYIFQGTFVCNLQTPMNFRFVRLVVNGLHPNNFENILTMNWLAVRQGETYFPIQGESNPGINMTTSITPYGFDNNYNYTDSLKRPLVPVITVEAPDFWTPPVNNATLSNYGSDYFRTRTNGSYYSNQNMFVHNMDNKWAYKTNLGYAQVTAEKWVYNTVTRNIGNPVPDFNDYFRETSGKLKTGLNNSLYYANISLGNYLFTWPELHLYMDSARYAAIKGNNDTSLYNEFIRFGLYHYNKLVKDGTWRRSYSLSLDQLERFYEGSTITTYVYPCSVGDAGSNCQVYNNRVPVTGINNLRPDQEIPDERFTWPQPYQGGSYLVSSSVKCIAGQTCNSAGGNTTNVTPKYCFWIGDAATYTALINAGFPTQQEFNMNIMFDGDTNVYNDVPSQCLGKLTLNNLDMSPLNQFYPPPALYRQKGWKLIDDPNGENLWSGGVKLKNAMISENNQVVFTFPDVATALAYKEFDPNTGETTKVFSGCQGPSLVGTNVTISCPAGKLKATSGGAEESKPHIRWGKWNTSVCRDSFGDNQIEAPYRDLPSRCVGQSTCTITESDFGWSNPVQPFDPNAVVSNVRRLEGVVYANNEDRITITGIIVWTSPTTYLNPNDISVFGNDGSKWAMVDSDINSAWEHYSASGGTYWFRFHWNSPINVYKIDLLGSSSIPSRCSGITFTLYDGSNTALWTSQYSINRDGSGDTLWDDANQYPESSRGHRFHSWWPGISTAEYISTSRFSNYWEYPLTTFAYNPPESAVLSAAKSISFTYNTGSSSIRYMQISDIKIYTSPTTLLDMSTVTIYTPSTLSGYPASNMIDGIPNSFWHSGSTNITPRPQYNPGCMMILPDGVNIHHIVIGNRKDGYSSRATGMIVNIRNADGRVIFGSQPFKDKNSSITTYSDGNSGYGYYGIFPTLTSAVVGSDSPTIEAPTPANLYQKRQWQVGFQCDYSDLSRVQRYRIPVGITSRQLHENYYNLMKQVNHQTVGVYDIRDYPETLKWYGESMKQEVLNSPQMKEELRKKEREHYKALKRGKVDDGDQSTTGREHSTTGREHSTTGREHYWDGDVCKPIGEVFETVANGVLEGIYNPIVSGINKIGLLKRGLGLTTQTVSIDWSCPIPGLGEAIGAIVNAAIAVGQAFVAAFNFVCELGEALVGAVINAGKYLFNRLGQVFTKERLGRFFRGFSNGLTGGYSLIGSLTDNFSWVGDAISNLGNLVVNLGNSVAQFFMNPSIDNFVAVIGNLLTLGIEAFIFVLEIGLSILTFFADLVGAVIGFIADVASWIINSVVGPVVDAIRNAAAAVLDWLCFWC